MSLEEALSAVEQLIDKVSAALLAADPLILEKHSTALRDAVAQLTHVREQESARGAAAVSADVKQRLDAVARALVVHRESLARLAATTDRQLTGLLPPSDAASTYGNGSNAGATRPSVARIYRSAG